MGGQLGDDPTDFRMSNIKQLSETMIGAPAIQKNDLDATKSSSASAATNPQDIAAAQGNLDFVQPMRSSD
jgi:hypothetical protein|tara:strand:- start:408 stop:617 length:210 start_codon:yes stop_codon:yes gene_type:complete